MDNLKNQNNL